jgi:hypothetical protein
MKTRQHQFNRNSAALNIQHVSDSWTIPADPYNECWSWYCICSCWGLGGSGGKIDSLKVFGEGGQIHVFIKFSLGWPASVYKFYFTVKANIENRNSFSKCA